MPEWPDLHVLRTRLESLLVGRAITAVIVRDPIVIRATDEAATLLVGRRFLGVRHRGKFVLLDLDHEVIVVVNPMLSGLFAAVPQAAKVKATTCLTLALDDGTHLWYLDDTRMGKVYVLRGSRPEVAVPGFADLGPEAGDAPSIASEFAARVKARRGTQIRNLLLDQTFVAGIGNAYADEILWEARLHPRRTTGSLGTAEVAALQAAIGTVMEWAAREVDGAMPAELGLKPRGHLRVRGRSGTPCPRCGTGLVLRHGGVKEMVFCPTCQPNAGSGPFGAPY